MVAKSSYVSTCSGDFYAFELMMAPYAVGHLKMSFFLEELGHRLGEGERFRFYLTNTLEMTELEQTHLPGMASLAEESHLAGEVKKQRPILVILGNPPYSGHSSNRGDWILGLIADYRQIDGKPLRDRNPKWLQDDYVKFLRFAQWKVDQEGLGVVGMITNHSYLDSPTFRGMRPSLMRTFDKIYTLNLHGNSLRRETAPDGTKDENVFDIRQGVAISFFLRRSGRKRGAAVVQHADLWGVRESKYDWLLHHDVYSTDWEEVRPKSESYLFVPRDEDALKQYRSFVSISDIFPLKGAGITTARDRFAVDMNKRTLASRIHLFKCNKGDDDDLHSLFDIRKKKGWSIRKAWEALQNMDDTALSDLVVPVLYRPFDVRWIFYHDSVVWRTVKRIMRHMLAAENVGMVVPRRVEVAGPWCHGLATDLPIDHVALSSKTIDYLFPLYVYPNRRDANLLTDLETEKPEANLSTNLVRLLGQAYGEEPSPEDVLHFIYAVLYARDYREKYIEFLRRGFPRIPFTADVDMFKALRTWGEHLVALHLLRSDELATPSVRFEGQGDNGVSCVKRRGFGYEPGLERVYINDNQYFGPVGLELWEYQIGGYQVLEKWLKDRRDRQLSLQEIKTYCKVVTAIKRTIEIQEEIDALYPEVEKSIVVVGDIG